MSSVAPALSRWLRWLERDHPAWVCLLPGLALLAFADKAFHIDDPQFLIHARLITAHPFDPYTQQFEWDSMTVAIIDFPHPLLWQYLIAAVVAVAGETEWVLHLLTFGFGLLALYGLRGLALQLSVSPLAACLLFAASSAFLVMGSTIMPDLVAVGLSLAALHRLAPAVEERRSGTAVLVGVLAGCAFLTRFSAALTVGALLAYPVLRRAWRPCAYLPAAVALGMVAASELVSFAVAGRPHFWSSLFRWSTTTSLQRDLHFAFDEIVFLGAQLPLTGLALFALAARSRRAALGVGAALAGALGLAALAGRQHSLVLPALLFGWPGMALVFDATARLGVAVWHRLDAPDAATALRWILAGILVAGTFATFRYEHVAVKYLLLPLPAAVLFVLDAMVPLRGRMRQVASTLLWVSCGIGAAIGLAVAVSDYRWANGYREFADTELRERAAPAGRSYYNAQWGLRYYAERAGLQPYRGGGLQAGDELLMSAKVPPNWELAGFPRGVAARWELSYPGPFAMLDFELGAAFYSNFWGDYPFVPAREVRDTVFLLRNATPTGRGRVGAEPR